MTSIPSFSVVVEWDNARISEARRAQAMLRRLHDQIAALVPQPETPPKVLVLYDSRRVEKELLERTVAAAFPTGGGAIDVHVVPTEGLGYYELKNRGAAMAAGDVIVFLDSDVVPDDGWLVAMLAAMLRPGVRAVCGNTYIEPSSLYRKAFALFWFFPLRGQEEAGEVRPSPHGFFANNVAFERDLFTAHGFPEMQSFRGQCAAFADTLRQEGVEIYRQPAARVSHPPPNGLRHFVARALCEGHDAVMMDRHLGRSRLSSLARAVWRYARYLLRAEYRVVRNRRTVDLGPAGAVAVIGLAVCYYSLFILGEALTHIDPGLIRRNFPI